jgi:SAM-dependent methyltransferase
MGGFSIAVDAGLDRGDDALEAGLVEEAAAAPRPRPGARPPNRGEKRSLPPPVPSTRHAPPRRRLRPGSITLGLAEAVADGEAVGIDIGADTFPSPAHGGGAEGEVSTRFLAGDVNALPFADASFDTVFCHAVLQHLRDPLAALREFRRVLRPGGVIGVADADYDGSIIAPADPALDASTRLLEDLRARTTGGDLRIGKHLPRLHRGCGRCPGRKWAWGQYSGEGGQRMGQNRQAAMPRYASGCSARTVAARSAIGVVEAAALLFVCECFDDTFRSSRNRAATLVRGQAIGWPNPKWTSGQEQE